MAHSAFLIVTMQGGFALLEAGSVRKKNQTDIIVKNILNMCVVCIAWYMCGFGIVYGGNSSFVGDSDGFWADEVDGMLFFVTMTLAALASSVCSGSTGERGTFGCFLVLSFCTTAIIFPFAFRWTKVQGGWLKDEGFIDFGCGAAVNVVGGAVGLVSSILTGPRLAVRVHDGGKEMLGAKGHLHLPRVAYSPMNVLYGTFVLWVGWIGWATIGVFDLTNGFDVVASFAAVNAVIGGSVGGTLGIIVSTTSDRHLSRPLWVSSGILCGLSATHLHHTYVSKASVVYTTIRH